MLDQLQRPLRDLRISLTDRCNLRCTYCMPKEIFGADHVFLRKDQWLRFQELHRIIDALTPLGLAKIRLTGGEPLLRPGLPRFIEGLVRTSSIKDIAITTNGLRLAERAHELREAGLHRVTVSLDAIDATIAGKINGLGVPPAAVIAGIDAAISAGFHLKLNSVIQRGVNESQIIPLARFAKERAVEIRFIEFMDVGNHNHWKPEDVVSGAEILQILATEFTLDPLDLSSATQVAKTHHHRDGGTPLGVITSITQPFCSGCTRLRLSADGKLFTCLFATHGFDLREFLRTETPDDETLRLRLRQIWSARDDRYSEIRSALQDKPTDQKVEMSYIGG